MHQQLVVARHRRAGLARRLFGRPFHTLLDRIDRGLEAGPIEAHLPDGTHRLLGGRAPGPVPIVGVHDQTNRGLAHMLVEMPFGEFPMALGVIYDDPAPTFDSAVVEQNRAAAAGKKPDLQKLLSQGQTWQVDKQPYVI